MFGIVNNTDSQATGTVHHGNYMLVFAGMCITAQSGWWQETRIRQCRPGSTSTPIPWLQETPG